MSDNPIKDFEQCARDALYTAVGLAVLGFQKAQVRRREIAEALGEKGIGDQVRSAGQNFRPPLRPQIEALRPQIDALRPQIDALRPQAEAIGTQLWAATVALRPQVESLGAGLAVLLKSMDEHAGPVRHEVGARVSEIEGHLPPGARAGFAQLRSRAAVQEETLRWIIGLLAPQAPSSEDDEDVAAEHTDVAGEDVAAEHTDVAGEDVAAEHTDLAGEDVAAEHTDLAGEDVAGEPSEVAGEQSDVAGEQSNDGGEQGSPPPAME